MTEEEIIRYCKALIEDMKMHHDVDDEVYIHENDYKAIEGLLDLYRKQKEDIMYLRMDVQELADDVEFWQDRCDNSVDKDDIRHKIKNINENIENLNNSCEFESAYVQAELEELRTKKHSLEELLEEN